MDSGSLRLWLFSLLLAGCLPEVGHGSAAAASPRPEPAAHSWSLAQVGRGPLPIADLPPCPPDPYVHLTRRNGTRMSVRRADVAQVRQAGGRTVVYVGSEAFSVREGYAVVLAQLDSAP